MLRICSNNFAWCMCGGVPAVVATESRHAFTLNVEADEAVTVSPGGPEEKHIWRTGDAELCVTAWTAKQPGSAWTPEIYIANLM